MKAKKFREIITERMRIARETQDNWDYGIEQCWEKEIALLSEDMSWTISFIKNECTDDEFYWMSEVFDDIALRTQSREFIAATKERIQSVSDVEKARSVQTDIDFAEAAICG